MLCVPVDENGFAAVHYMDLCPLPVILVLHGELRVLHLVQDLGDAICGFCQHGLDRNAGHEVDVLLQFLHSPHNLNSWIICDNL